MTVLIWIWETFFQKHRAHTSPVPPSEWDAAFSDKTYKEVTMPFQLVQQLECVWQGPHPALLGESWSFFLGEDLPRFLIERRPYMETSRLLPLGGGMEQRKFKYCTDAQFHKIFFLILGVFFWPSLFTCKAISNTLQTFGWKKNTCFLRVIKAAAFQVWGRKA